VVIEVGKCTHGIGPLSVEPSKVALGVFFKVNFGVRHSLLTYANRLKNTLFRVERKLTAVTANLSYSQVARGKLIF